jgi:hypothetical protein
MASVMSASVIVQPPLRFAFLVGGAIAMDIPSRISLEAIALKVDVTNESGVSILGLARQKTGLVRRFAGPGPA